CCLFFFFSSRRRHTSLVSDWSSDVCSSDLIFSRCSRDHPPCCSSPGCGSAVPPYMPLRPFGNELWLRLMPPAIGSLRADVTRRKIGRASCRERGEVSGGGGSLEKKEVAQRQ